MAKELSHRRRAARRRHRRQFGLFLLVFVGASLVGVGLWASAQLTPEKVAQADLQPIPSAAPTTAAPSAAPSSAPPSATVVPASTEPLVRIAVIGDAGTRGKDQMRVAKQIAESDSEGRHFDAMLMTGDLVYDKGESDLTGQSVVQPYANIFKKSEIYPALGNHDVESDEAEDIMRKLGREPTYVADIGPVHVISLNSNNVSDRQTDWLKQALASSPTTPETWVLPIMHHPAYSSSKHGSEKPVRDRWVPLFSQAGVKLVLAGHDHDYERTTPQGGTVYITTGGGGAELYNAGRSGFTATSAMRHHFLDLTVYADRIEGKAVDVDGEVFDTFTINKPTAAQPPAAQSTDAAQTEEGTGVESQVDPTDDDQNGDLPPGFITTPDLPDPD